MIFYYMNFFNLHFQFHFIFLILYPHDYDTIAKNILEPFYMSETDNLDIIKIKIQLLLNLMNI